MTQKDEQKQKSREAILQSAATFLRARGIQASSVADVMQGAGLTVGGFYNHFASKEELFATTIRAAASTMWRGLMATATGESPRERVVSVLSRYLSRTHRDGPESGCMLPNLAPEVARAGEPYRSVLEQELGGFVTALADLLEGDPARREKAAGLIALSYGALSLSRAVAGTPLSDEFLRAAKKLVQRSLADEHEQS